MIGFGVALLAVLFVTNVSGQDVRLNDEFSPYEGVVEVYIPNVSAWVRICDNIRHWSIAEADVTCYDLGHKGGAMWNVSRSNGSNWSGKWMTQLTCKGDEVALLDCAYEINEVCGSQNSAGVSCNFAGYSGCFADNLTDRALSGKTFTDVANMTIEMCLQLCRNNSFTFAGVENGDECYCGAEDSNFWKHGVADNENCDAKCQGDNNQSCGGSIFLLAPLYIGIYEANMGGCGGLINDDGGMIYSPNFPGFYPASIDCDWLISSPGNSSISSKIPMFDLRNENDFVEFRDGETRASTLMGKYTKSGKVINIPDTSSNKMLITFVAFDGGDATRGFFSVDFKALIQCFYDNSGMVGNTNQTKINVGETLSVQCLDGYTITTNYTNVTCLDDGSWDDDVPQCRKDSKYVQDTSHKVAATILMLFVVFAILGVILFIIHQRLSKNKKDSENLNVYIDDTEVGQRQQNDYSVGPGREANHDQYQAVGGRVANDEAELYWDDYANVDQRKNVNADAGGDHYTPMHSFGQGDVTKGNDGNLRSGVHSWKEEDEWFEENPLRSNDQPKANKSTITSDNSVYAVVANPESELVDNVINDRNGVGGDGNGDNMPSERQKLYKKDEVANRIPGDNEELEYERMYMSADNNSKENLYVNDNAEPNGTTYKGLTDREKSSYYSLVGIEDKHTESDNDPMY